MVKSYDPYPPEMDISYASSVRPTSNRMFPSFHDNSESVMNPQYAIGNNYDDRSFPSTDSASTSIDMGSPYNYSYSSQDSGQTSWYSQNTVRTLDTVTEGHKTPIYYNFLIYIFKKII